MTHQSQAVDEAPASATPASIPGTPASGPATPTKNNTNNSNVSKTTNTTITTKVPANAGLMESTHNSNELHLPILREHLAPQPTKKRKAATTPHPGHTVHFTSSLPAASNLFNSKKSLTNMNETERTHEYLSTLGRIIRESCGLAQAAQRNDIAETLHKALAQLEDRQVADIIDLTHVHKAPSVKTYAQVTKASAPNPAPITKATTKTAITLNRPTIKNTTVHSSKSASTSNSTSTKAAARLPLTARDTRTNKVVLQTDTPTTSESINSTTIRDNINKALGCKAVVGVDTSSKGNIVLTLQPDTVPATEMVARKSQWTSALHEHNITDIIIPESWIKLVAYLPVNLENYFTRDLHEFFGVKVLGTPYWVKEPAQGQYKAPLVFAVASQEERTKCLQGIRIGGIKVTVTAFRAFSKRSQCQRCQGYGHNPATCRAKVACRWCGQGHLTHRHCCKECGASDPCDHVNPKCANCQGAHAANSEACTLRPKSPAASPNQPTTTVTS